MFNWSKEQTFFFGFLLVLLVALFSHYYFPFYTSTVLVHDARSYESGRYGLFFWYPSKYKLIEKDIPPAAPLHHMIQLVDKAATIVPDGEFPPSIIVDIYENEPGNMSARDFMERNAGSNFALGDRKFASSTRGSLTGLEYTWSGLYQGRSFVVARRGYIYLFSVTTLRAGDEINRDFDSLMSTAVLAE